jgi:hypothetical protein
MRLNFRLINVLLTLGVLAGCAMPETIVPNATSAVELLQRLGKPTDIRVNPQGGEYWEYAYGPEGTETWLFGIDRGKMVRSSTQLLTEERLHRVVPGVTTETQVRELLGAPRKTTQFREEIAWEWRVDLSPNLGEFVVRFNPAGVVTGYNVLVDIPADSHESDGP